ncbi:unnamed protein product [Strongylus vulgaris]|uniref:Fungal lipase-type domain-containing protein n=1 Tax=Strongylus vulgaris TaxID=40348 RepID=A0A3P7JFL2_STRVU|nr:unnamed protein product [Strongylus vulgaris]
MTSNSFRKITLFLLSVIIAALAQRNTGYDHDFVRGTIFPLCAAAYSDTPTDCLKAVDPKAEKVQKFTVTCGGANTCSGYTALLHSHKAIVLAFRGSKTITQFLKIAWMTLTESRCRWKADTGQVATYFCDAFIKIWDRGLKENLKQLIEDNRDYRVWVR